MVFYSTSDILSTLVYQIWITPESSSHAWDAASSSSSSVLDRVQSKIIMQINEPTFDSQSVVHPPMVALLFRFVEPKFLLFWNRFRRPLLLSFKADPVYWLLIMHTRSTFQNLHLPYFYFCPNYGNLKRFFLLRSYHLQSPFFQQKDQQINSHLNFLHTFPATRGV